MIRQIHLRRRRGLKKDFKADPPGKPPRSYRVWQRAASLLLPVILVGTVWLASDSDARAGFKSWFRTEQENSASYDFVGERDPEPLPEYEFATLPEGFVETNFLGGETTHIRIYENNGEELFLSYAKMAEGIATGVFQRGSVTKQSRLGPVRETFMKWKSPMIRTNCFGLTKKNTFFLEFLPL